MIGAGNGVAERDQESLLRNLLLALRLDPPLLFALLLLSIMGMFVLYSAGGEDPQLMWRQGIRLGIGFVIMAVLAQIPPRNLRQWTPWIFALGIVVLIAVLELGQVGKGARRWLDLGLVRFQPSEIMKLAVPMMVAAYLSEKTLPPTWRQLLVALLMVVVPMLLIAKQPDLGTALLIGTAGFFVIFLGGIRWRILLALAALVPLLATLAWEFLLHDYQRRRVLTFLNPESDPLGSGYHIIQSKIAIGSGGLYGKGWLNGTQSQLDFLPERSTDFIFSVFGEEFGLVGALILLSLYLLIIYRGLYIGATAPDTFGRLLAGALSLTFFVYVFVNAGMVTGLLPVVGVPLPMVSYGGTSMVTLMAGFGILMSIHSHRRRLAT